MRRKKQEITERSKIEEILRRERVGRLATVGGDGYPYIVPLNYVYSNATIYFHCALAGEKLGNISRNDKVCFEVDTVLSYIDLGFDSAMEPCDVGQFFQSVIIRGRAELIDDPEEKLAALNALVGSHEGISKYDGIKSQMKAVQRCHVVGIRIEKISGKENIGMHKDSDTAEKFLTYLEKRNLPEDRKTVELMKQKESSDQSMDV